MEAAGKVVPCSVLPPAWDFLGEEVAAAPRSSGLVLPPHLPHPMPLRILALLPTSIAWLAGAARVAEALGSLKQTMASPRETGEGGRLVLVQGTSWRAGGPQGVLALRGHLTSPGHPDFSICKEVSHATSQSWGWLHSRAPSGRAGWGN